jgi:sugar (pentulose or hexulose) kinase
MKSPRLVVIDIGKTNAKLLQLDANSGEICWKCEQSYESVKLEGYRQLPLQALENWLWQALATMPNKHNVSHLVPVTHGAAAVLIDPQGNVLAAPDYEDTIYETTDAAYRPERDTFTSCYSPLLPQGLNLGRQLHWLQLSRPQIFLACAQLLLYPQYWAWRLSDVMASEVTSLGCHTDLWQPLQHRFSDYAQRSGWAAHLPPLRGAHEILGTLTAEVVAKTGLPANCQVLCGVHDSNAAYHCQLSGRASDAGFAVISSGTWIITMARGTDLTRLDAKRDMLANVDAQGEPVATARFMGGREYALIAGPLAARGSASPAALQRVVTQRAYALPSFAAGSGPYPERKGQLTNADTLDIDQRSALATLYLALMCEQRLAELGASGDVVIDGPLAADPLFAGVMAALLPHRKVLRSDGRAGIARGALQLAFGERAPRLTSKRCKPLAIDGLHAYREHWHRQLR